MSDLGQQATSRGETNAAEDGLWRVWVLAFAPLLVLALDVALQGTSVVTGWYTVVGVYGFHFVSADKDRKQLAEAGVQVNSLLPFVPPAYLVARTKATKSNPAIPALWFASLLVTVIGYNHVVGVPLDMPRVERVIAHGIHRQGGIDAVVRCPASEAPKVGGSFECIARAKGLSPAFVKVTLQDRHGTILWRAQ